MHIDFDRLMVLRRGLKVFNHVVELGQMTLLLCFDDKEKKINFVDLHINSLQEGKVLIIGNFLVVWIPKRFGPTLYHVNTNCLRTYKKTQKRKPLIKAIINKDLAIHPPMKAIPIRDWRLRYEITYGWDELKLPGRSLRKSEINHFKRLVRASAKEKYQDKKEMLDIFLGLVA